MVVVLFILPKLFRLGKGGQGLRATVNLSVILAVLLAVVTLTAPLVMEMSFSDYVYSTHYAKIFEQEGSGAVRFATVVSGVEVFLDSPILGVGFGSHRTASLLTSLLSNVGLVGTLAFLWFNIVIVRRAVRVCRRSRDPQLISVCYALLIAFGTLFPVMLIAKGMVALAQGWYWLILAMIETCHRLYLQQSAEVVDDAASEVLSATHGTSHQPSIS
jgi:O-antigen ligase